MQPKDQPQLQPQVFKEIAKLESEAEGVALLKEAIAESLAQRPVQKLLGENKAPRERKKLQAKMEDIFKSFLKGVETLSISAR